MSYNYDQPYTDFQIIRHAHERAEADGYVSINRMPEGFLTIDQVFADAAQPQAINDFDLDALAGTPKPVDRHGNGFAGTSRTFRAAKAPGAKPVEAADDDQRRITPGQVGAHFDEETDRQVGDKFRLLTEEELADGEDSHWVYGVTAVRTEAELEDEVAAFLQRRQAERQVGVTRSLREQPYAKGYGTATTPQEIAYADRLLAKDSAQRGKQQPNHWLW